MSTELAFYKQKEPPTKPIEYKILRKNEKKIDEYDFDPQTGNYQLRHNDKTGVYRIPPQTDVLFISGDEFYLVNDWGSRVNVYYGKEPPEQGKDGKWFLPKAQQILPLEYDLQESRIGNMQAGLFLRIVQLDRVVSHNPPTQRALQTGHLTKF